MKIILTSHAIARYIERHAPHLGYTEAKLHLLGALGTLRFVKENEFTGDAQWEILGSVPVIVKKMEALRALILVTVLPKAAPEDSFFAPFFELESSRVSCSMSLGENRRFKYRARKTQVRSSFRSEVRHVA